MNPFICYICGEPIKILEKVGYCKNEKEDREPICYDCNILLKEHVALVIENSGKRTDEVIFVSGKSLRRIFPIAFDEDIQIFTLDSDSMRIVTNRLLLNKFNKN